MESLKRWRQKRAGLLIFGLAELLLAYVFASLSISSGNLLFYLLTIVSFLSGIGNIFKLIGTFTYGRRQTS